MTPVTTADLMRVLTFLPRNRFTYLLRRTVTPTTPADPPRLKPKTVLVMGLYDWFAHLGGYITDDQQQRLVQKFDGQLGLYSNELAKFPAALTLSDGRYAAVSGRTVWYDYELDEDVPELPGPAVTHVACDLTALQLRLHRRLAELRGGKDAAQRSDGAAGRPADGPG